MESSPENIMNIRDLIDSAFGGDFEGNAVNFKLLQTLLVLFARQLRLLERRVEVDFGPIKPTNSTLSVTEVKIYATQKKKPKSKDEGRGGKGTTAEKRQKSIKQPDRISAPQTTSDKISTDKTISDKTSTYQTSTDKTSTYQTSTDKTSTYQTSTDKTSTDQTSTDKTSPDKTSTDKTSTDMTSTDKTSTDKTSTDKTSTDKTSVDITSTIMTSTDKTSTEKTTTSSKDKSTSKSSTGKSVSLSEPSGFKGLTVSQLHVLDSDEERKERLLRVIHQRANSEETATKTPTPMTSVTSMDALYEKLLVVERTPSSESKKSWTKGQTPQISVVTQEQFERMAKVVRQLENRLLPVGKAGFPEHIELMQELKRGASLTDAMAALQLSARLEASEKAMGHMVSIITEIAAQTPGVEIDEETRLIFEAPGAFLGSIGTQKKKPEKGRHKRSGSSKSSQSSRTTDQYGTSSASSPGRKTRIPQEALIKSYERDTINVTTFDKSVESTEEVGPVTKPIDETPAPDDQLILKPEYIKHADLNAATKDLYEKMIHTLNAITARTNTTAETAQRLVTSLEGRIESALGACARMSNLESLVSQYAERINALDTGLTSQMTNYQEQLTQMQHDLESGLESMAEALASTGGDTAAISELNSRFSGLQMDFENMIYRQRDLKDALDAISCDLEILWKQIEMLRETKSDREEVADALRDKAGIGDLNGLVSLQQFHAVEGDFQKRIRAAYDKFNNQESIWQKAISDLLRILNEKADIIQVDSLRDEINKYLNIMRTKIQFLQDIVGEPKSATLSKILFRDTSCLSCGSPAKMKPKEPCLVPALPKLRADREPAEGAEAETKLNGNGDHKPCYPGLPLPHPRDPRSYTCHRYCGGSHTLISEGPVRIPPSVAVIPAVREVNIGQGTDGKMYMVDEEPEKVPCLPCNKPKSTPQSTPEKDTTQETFIEKVTAVNDLNENDNAAENDSVPLNDNDITNENVNAAVNEKDAQD